MDVACATECPGDWRGAGARMVRAGAPSLRPRPGRPKPRTFAAGCFWCVEEAFDKVAGRDIDDVGLHGVAGRQTRPTSRCRRGGTGHTEAVEVTYDPSKVSYETLLADVLAQRRCRRRRWAVLRSRQLNTARASTFSRRNSSARPTRRRSRSPTQLGKPIATEILPAGPFYPAEGYHQDYYKKNPVRYKFYKWNCGRAQRLEKLWGK